MGMAEQNDNTCPTTMNDEDFDFETNETVQSIRRLKKLKTSTSSIEKLFSGVMSGKSFDYKSNDNSFEIKCYYTDDAKNMNCYSPLQDASPCVATKMKKRKNWEPGFCTVAVYQCVKSDFFKCLKIPCKCGCIKRRRELLGDSDDDDDCKGCLCFGGENKMMVKRDGIIKNIKLKELKIGDYVQSKHIGEWTKVWWIKKEKEILNI